MRNVLVPGGLFLAASATLAFGGSAYPGTYSNGEVTLEILVKSPTAYAVVVHTGDQTLQFTAQQEGDALVGAFMLDDEPFPFHITLQDQTLTFDSEEQTYTLTRRAPDDGALGAGSRLPAPKAPLRVNRRVIPEEQIRGFEQQYHQTLPRGDFWYDRVSGAWGVDGGPTLGFTAPGISIGGMLPADASRGDTGVFINGRQLPTRDVADLMQMGVPVQQGRWWVDAAGNFGVEGVAAASGNLFQFSRGKGGAYQRATASGYIGGDGQTAYFFDPSTGSSVMTGN